MAGRRGCVNSLWSGTERVRIGERLKATLAGVLELQVLRCKHLEMVDAALEDRVSAADDDDEEPRPEVEEGAPQGAPQCAASGAEHGSATSRRQQTSSPMTPRCQSPEDGGTASGEGTVHSSSARGGPSRWSTLSWDAPSDLLSPPTPDPSGGVHQDSDSRPSSGFYSVSGSSLSDSCYSVSSEARALTLCELAPPSTDNTDLLWTQGATQEEQQEQQQEEQQEQSGPSGPRDLEASSLSFLADLCSGPSYSLIVSLLPLLDPVCSSAASSPQALPQLDPRYCSDLVSRRTKEVYPYPSPLHAVALQSPLFTSQSQEQSVSAEVARPPEPALRPPPTGPASITQLEKYICRLAHQHHSRVASSSSSDLCSASSTAPPVHRGLCTPGKGHGSTLSLSAFESRSTSSTAPGGSTTPCDSLLGNSVRGSLSAAGKKAARNSINLGNLPSATGEDMNINLHLSLNLNLAPGSNSGWGPVDAAVSTASTSSSATPTPALRARPRISTCPSSLSHRSSLEVPAAPGPSLGSDSFCRSLDRSSGAQPKAGPSAPGSQRSSLIRESGSSPQLSEDSPVVGEISRLSGLTRAVVVGLMEQGVELDIDCFQTNSAGEGRGHGKSHLAPQADQSHDYARLCSCSPQRPIQLSLSVTHSPQSHSSSPIHPYQSSQYSSHCHYQHTPSPSEPPSSTASSPASRPTTRGRSPPRPLQPSPLGSAPLSVFRRDAPFQCSLPHTSRRTSPQTRSGSLRHSKGGAAGWRRPEGDGLYRGKHSSHKLIRAATVNNYGSVWGEEEEEEKAPNKLWRGFEGRLWDREYGCGGGRWRRENHQAESSSGSSDRRRRADGSLVFSKRRGEDDGEPHGSRRALFRSESQGLLVARGHSEEPRPLWVSSLDLDPGGRGHRDEESRRLRAKDVDKRLSSTASLFNLSRSQSLEGSCLSLSPLSSPSFSPSPPPRAPLRRSRSLRDLGRKMFGSMRSLSLKRKPSKK